MKKFALIVSIIVLSAGVALGGYFAYRFYKLSNDPLVKIFNNIDDLKVSESTATVHVSYSKDFFDKVIKGMPLGDIPTDVAVNVLSNMSGNVSVESKQKVVLDSEREDFGISSEMQYKYDDNKLISLNLATDFDVLTFGVPELLNKNVKLSFKELMGSTNDKPIDFRPYLEILKSDVFPSDRKKIYFKVVHEFLNNGHFEETSKEVSHPKYDVYDEYQIKLTYMERLELMQKLIDVFKDDEVTKDYVIGKMDDIFKQYIDSGDYKLSNMEKEDLEKAYAKDKATFLSNLESGKVDVRKYFEENVPNFSYMKDYRFIYTFDIDKKDGHIREYAYTRKGLYDNSTIELEFTALGDEVEVNPIVDLANTYDEPLGLEAPVTSLLRIFGEEAIDNLTNNILGSPAVEAIIGDVVKELKASPDFKGKKNVIEQVKNIKETVEKLILFYKFMGI